MEKNRHDWIPALLIGILSNAVLRFHTGYWSRIGILASGASILVLALATLWFSAGWKRWDCALLRCGLCVILAASSVLEILRLRSIYESLYPGTMGLTASCFVLLLPVVYLRRETALRQNAGAVLALLAIGLAAMLLSIAQQLRVTNLQNTSLTAEQWLGAISSQTVLYPEYLLLAVLPKREKSERSAVRLACSGVLFDTGIHLLLELFFGAAMPGRSSPVQAAAQCGALSIFNRLEWVQLVLWTMAVSVKLAVYLYTMVELLGGKTGQGNTAVGLDRFFWYLGGVLLFCILWRGIDLERAFEWRNMLIWAYALPVVLGGVIQCLSGIEKRKTA